MQARTATALAESHADIRDGLARAAHEKGPIGEAAQRATKYFGQHAEKEERLLFPLLALLPRVAENKIDPDMADQLPHFEELERVLPDMVAEHRMLSAALEKLVEAAKAEKRPDYGGFVARLLDHIKTEEAVIYPATLVLGRYLRIRLGRS